MVDPDGTLDALASLGLTSPPLPKPPRAPPAAGNGAAAPPEGGAARDFSLPLNRFTPSGEETDPPRE